MVLSLNSHVIGGVEMEEEELLRESGGGGEDCEGFSGGSGGSYPIEGNGKCSIKKEGEGDGGVFEIVEVVRGDCEIWIEGLVACRADEEFHGNGSAAAGSD